MIILRRKIIPVLWLCVALGLFVGLGSPVFSESYGVHDHLLVADTDDGGKTHHHTPAPDDCVYCHSWAACALVPVALPDKSLIEWMALLMPMRVPLPSAQFLHRTDDPVYSPSHPRGPPSYLLS